MKKNRDIGNRDIGIGYTLATGKMYAPMDVFHDYCEKLLNRPILTHEFADEKLWEGLREKYEHLNSVPHPQNKYCMKCLKKFGDNQKDDKFYPTP